MAAAHARSRRRRRYRGSHRQDGLRFAVGELQEAIAESAEQVRREHRRSLRRPGDPRPGDMVYLGEHVWGGKFYGSVPDPCGEAAGIRLTFVPADDAVISVPVLGLLSDDAPTGPIILPF
jgi:hypothetical protein